MAHYLLTGAGFSYNWGGWLAGEAFEYLLGAPETTPELRALLWANKESGGGFEDALATLEKEYADHGRPETQRQLNDLIAGIVGMLNGMSNSMERRDFEPHNNFQGSITELLLKFDALFTLNQDTLLEYHYAQNVMLRSQGRYQGLELPGTAPAGPAPVAFDQRHQHTAMRFPVGERFTVSPQHQPYFKMHGSRNYVNGPTGNRIIIMGGNKAESIPRIPLLQWYLDEFTRRISAGGAKLMVIGYSFSDKHINDAIAAGVDNGLKLFIIDPAGVDVIDKRRLPMLTKTVDPYVTKVGPAIIGASRRPLLQTFNQDKVEWDKVMRFFHP
jgi:hypothetical protein